MRSIKLALKCVVAVAILGPLFRTFKHKIVPQAIAVMYITATWAMELLGAESLMAPCRVNE
jgi:hypothetical protein